MRARGKNVEPVFTHFTIFFVVLILQAALHFETKNNDIGQYSHYYLFNLTLFNCSNNLTVFQLNQTIFK